MADPVIVITSALQAIQSGDEYLERRKGSATSTEEVVKIQDWQTNLRDLLVTLPPKAVLAAHPKHRHLPAQFDAIRQQFQGFHEFTDFNLIHGALSSLHDNVCMLAGTHGPGDGDPTGGPGTKKP